MTKKRIERARHLFNLIGWWAKMENNEHILGLAHEGYYLLGEAQDPFPNEEKTRELMSWIRPGIVLVVWLALLVLIVARCIGWI